MGQDEVDEAIVEEVRRQVGGKNPAGDGGGGGGGGARARGGRGSRGWRNAAAGAARAGQRVQELRGGRTRRVGERRRPPLRGGGDGDARLLELARAEWGAAPPSAMSAGTDEADPAPEERRQPRGALRRRRGAARRAMIANYAGVETLRGTKQ